MSHTLDSTPIAETLNSKDKLLKLAEISPSKTKKKGKNFHSTPKKNNVKQSKYDLAFTENIEHLVNKDNHVRSSTPNYMFKELDTLNTSLNQDVNSNLSCDSSCECSIHSINLKNLTLDGLVDNSENHQNKELSELKYFDSTNLPKSELKSRIPQPISKHSSINENHIIQGLNRWADSDNLNVDSTRFPPDLDKQHQIKMSLISKTQTNIFNRYRPSIINNNSNSVHRVIKSRSHNTLHGHSVKDGQLRYCSRFSPEANFYLSNNHQGKSYVDNSTVSNNENKDTQINQNLKMMFNVQFDQFLGIDEDNFTNSPKNIAGKKVNIDNNEKYFDCSLENRPLNIISTPKNKLYENIFLRESQRSSIYQIKNLKKVPKSSSCDNLDDVKFEPLSKPKSETDLSTKNDLSGITHLEENGNESVFNKFRKSFSLRFSKNFVQKPDQYHCLKDEVSIIKTSANVIKSDITNYNEIDINQNNICLHNDFENEPQNIGKMSTIERRKSRLDGLNRKSLRKVSRRNIRLKRSHSQPNDKLVDQINVQNQSLDVDQDATEADEFKLNSNSDFGDSPEVDEVIFAEAIFDYFSSDGEEISFNAGDLIDVTDTSHKQWWWGAIKTKDKTKYGWFPASYVRLKVSQEETLEEALANTNDVIESTPKKRMSMSKLSSEQVRANVVLEIINTERDFVKNLKDVIDGYLKPCRDQKDMFDDNQISTIFGNIEELFKFQTNFLAELEKCINWDNLSQSQIGNCFLNNEKGFSVYCEFCKNHPLAISELQDLYTDHKYVAFFEGCRLLQEMIDISLDGFLLTPIQKICKYPLQLGELLKYTRLDHSDYEPISNAYNCMQRVAQLVNERKRRFESLEQLISLQESFENWEGSNLLDSCSLLIHSGEITRVTSSAWSKDLVLFLFDHLLVLCKKDSRILKKSTYIFKTRIDTDHIESVISVEDNIKDNHFNVFAKNAFKFYYKTKQKWYLFQAKNGQEKNQWMKAFEEERQRVKEDEEQGFFVSEQDKRGAQIAHQNNLKPKKPKDRRVYPKTKKPDTVIAEIPLPQVNGFEIDRNRAGSLPSYIFQDKKNIGLYKNRQSTLHKKARSNWFQLGSNKKKSRLKRTLK